MIQLGYFEYAVRVICIPLNIPELVQFFQNLYIQKSIRITQSFLHLFTHLFPRPPPPPLMIYYQLVLN